MTTTVTDLATPPLRHARSVTAGHAADVTVAAELLTALGLMPGQLVSESSDLLALVDFDVARAQINHNEMMEDPMATDVDTAPELDISPATVRAWAKEQRLHVATIGPVPQAILNAYLDAQGVPLGDRARIARPAPVRRLEAAKVAAAKPAPPTVTPAVTVEPGPVTVAPTTVTPGPVAVTPPPATVTDVDHSECVLAEDLETAETQLDEMRERAETAERDARAEHAEVERLQAQNPAPFPEPLTELADAFRTLFSKASAVDTRVAHTLAEVTAPSIVDDATEQLHDLIRLLDGDVSR